MKRDKNSSHHSSYLPTPWNSENEKTLTLLEKLFLKKHFTRALRSFFINFFWESRSRPLRALRHVSCFSDYADSASMRLWLRLRDRIFKLLRTPTINSTASLCSLAGRYDNPIPSPHRLLKNSSTEPECVNVSGAQESIPRNLFHQPM